MLIETIVQPRKDGTVTLTVPNGRVYVFASDADGCLVADIDDADAGWVLSLGDFFPADESDDDVISNAPPVEVVPPPLEGASLVELLDNLDKSGLLEYAKQNGVDGVDGRMSVGTLRARIAEAMNEA